MESCNFPLAQVAHRNESDQLAGSMQSRIGNVRDGSGQKRTFLEFCAMSALPPESGLPKLITCPPFSVEIARPGPLRQIRDCNANLRGRLQLLMLMATLC